MITVKKVALPLGKAKLNLSLYFGSILYTFIWVVYESIADGGIQICKSVKEAKRKRGGGDKLKEKANQCRESNI